MVSYTFNPNPWEEEAGQFCEFEFQYRQGYETEGCLKQTNKQIILNIQIRRA